MPSTSITPLPPAWVRVHPQGPQGPIVDHIDAPEFTVGRFRCPPTASLWRRANWVGEAPLVVVPHHAVEILRAGLDPVLASPARSVFYNADQEYERRLVDPRGDDCTFFALRPDLLADVVATELGTAQVDPQAPFEFEGGTLTPRCFARYQAILRALLAAPADPAALLEPLLELVGALVRTGSPRAHPSYSARPGKAARHRALVHEVERLLGRCYPERTGLPQIAAAVGSSPYHLARVFRAVTGTTIHEYRTRLRINQAIAQLADPRASLTDLALALGFSSHSHFTEQFRRCMGLPPSALRARLRGAHGSPSTILTASPPPSRLASSA